MEDLSLHILDIAENAVAAGARNIVITITEDCAGDSLTVEVSDDGSGMKKSVADSAMDPFTTSRTTRRVGLGLPLLLEAARAANGGAEIESRAGRGTRVKATFQLSHVDRKPLGDMAETVAALLATCDDIDIRYEHIRNERMVLFDTRDLRENIGGGPLNTVRALNIIRTFLSQEENTLIHLS